MTLLLMMYITTNNLFIMYYNAMFFVLFFVSCPCIAINNVSVQHNNGGFLPGTIVLVQCYYHRGTRLNVMKRFCI